MTVSTSSHLALDSDITLATSCDEYPTGGPNNQTREFTSQSEEPIDDIAQYSLNWYMQVGMTPRRQVAHSRASKKIGR